MSDCCANNINEDFDVAVIGAGSAGFSAAITAADEGARVALIGHGTIGGTCVNVGCVPSKALIRAVETLHNARASARFDGIDATATVTDWSALMRQKQALVDDLRQAKYTDVLTAYDRVNYFQGEASFGDDGGLRMDSQPVAANKVIIATGTRPTIPAIDGIESVPYLTSTTALELEALPKSLLVIGAGYIGAEIAQAYARAGVSVTIVSRRGLLPEAEPEISRSLTGHFESEGITFVKSIRYQSIQQASDGVELLVSGPNKNQILRAEKVLIATGRMPNTDRLNLPNASIDTRDNGAIVIDGQMRTSRDNVYAAGDVTGTDQFVYMAAYGAKLAAKNAFNGNSLSYDNTAMPAVVFTDPQVASVGLTEAAAEKAGHAVKVSVLTLDNVPRALAARDTRGLIKLVADADSHCLLGAHILAPEGADSIQTAAMAIKAGMTYDELGAMIFPYLTTVEGIKLAAQTFDMNVKNLSCCAG
ncbi:MAG: mercury(II) reductase [Burkholderiaceae bacterium]